MKKPLLTLTALLVVGTASAQSSVTLFGLVDAAVTYGSGSVSSKTALTNSGLGAAQLGFQGTEELGGGMRAGFWLEATPSTDDGTGLSTNTNNQASGATTAGGLTFNRRSTVSIGGNWGELRLGRDYTPSYWNLAVYDPYGNLGVGNTLPYQISITGVTSVRASNSIAYVYGQPFNAHKRGNIADQGLYGELMYYLGENASGAATSEDGNGLSARVGYNKGPFTVAIGVGRTKYAAGDVQQNNIGGSYDFGAAKLMAHYASDKNGAVSAKGYLIGALIPVGVNVIRAAYSSYETDAAGAPATKKLALGYVYNLSKRSALYATVAQDSNSGTAARALGGAVTAVGGTSTGYDFGIKHSF